MSKKKPARVIQMPTSPETQIRTRARNLKIGKCYINEDWDDSREAVVIITREHVNGNLTVGFFLVDLAMQGIKEATYRFNMPMREFEEIKDESEFSDKLIEIDYNFAHNLIYGALEYGEENGYNPHKDFAIGQYILEEDTDDIPLIEFEFGVDGKPMLFDGLFDDLDDDDDDDDDLDDFDGDDYTGEDDIWVDPDMMGGWDDDIEEMGVSGWGEAEWENFLTQPMEDYSFRAFQYYVDQRFLSRHPELNELDAFKQVLGTIELNVGGKPLSTQEQKILDRTSDFMEKQQMDEAYSFLQKNLEKLPDSVALHTFLFGLTLLKSDEEIARAYGRYLKQFPEHLAFRNMYAEYFVLQGMSERVPEIYENKECIKALYPGMKKIDPIFVESFCDNYCSYYVEEEELVKAEPFYQVLDTITDPEDYFLRKGTLYRAVIAKFLE